MKHCKECGAQKAEADFYARRNSCKECVKASVRRNYAQNREHYREYERSRNSLPHRKEARDNYTKTESGKERSNAAKRAYIQRNPEKRIAHNLTQSALKRSKVWRSPCCMAQHARRQSSHPADPRLVGNGKASAPHRGRRRYPLRLALQPLAILNPLSCLALPGQ